MTTEPLWVTMELVEPTAPGRRGDTLVALTQRLEQGLRRLGAREAVATYWSPVGVPDTRLARAKGFWKARLDVAGTVPASSKLSDEPVVASDGLHFLSSARTPLSELARLVLSVLDYERNRACIFVPLGAGLWPSSSQRVHEALAEARFEVGLVEALSAEAHRQKSVVVVPAGRFDDGESGFVVNGPMTLMDTVIGLSEVGR